MNYYQIQPTSYIDKLLNNELYQKAGAFQNYWRLFYKEYVKENDITEIKDEDIEHFKTEYSQRTLAKVFNVKSKNTAIKWCDEFIDVIENFIAHWKLVEMQKNSNKDNSTQNGGDHLLTSKCPASDQKVTTPLTKNNIDETPEKSLKNDDEKKSSDHPTDQKVTTYCPVSDQQVTKYKTYNNNINNNNKKIINKEWLEKFFAAISKISKDFTARRGEFERVFINLFTLYDDVEEVIEWASRNDFWADKLIDPRSIRKNYEKMRLQMLKEKSKRPIPNGPDKVRELQEDIAMLRAIYEKKLKENKGVA